MVFRSHGVESGQLVEHGSTPLGRWLRARRLRIAAWVALIEGLLVLIHAVPRIPAIILAAAIIVFYFGFGRQYSDRLRACLFRGKCSVHLFLPTEWRDGHSGWSANSTLGHRISNLCRKRRRDSKWHCSRESVSCARRCDSRDVRIRGECASPRKWSEVDVP